VATDEQAAFGVGSAFVGRARELDELRAGLADAVSGRGCFFMVSGEPGIGKTRLVDELAAEARRQGVQVLWGRCTTTWHRRSGSRCTGTSARPWNSSTARVGVVPPQRVGDDGVPVEVP